MPLRNSLFVHQLPQGHLSTKTQSRTNSFGNASPKYVSLRVPEPPPITQRNPIGVELQGHRHGSNSSCGCSIPYNRHRNRISHLLRPLRALFIATARSRLVNGLRLSGPKSHLNIAATSHAQAKDPASPTLSISDASPSHGDAMRVDHTVLLSILHRSNMKYYPPFNVCISPFITDGLTDLPYSIHSPLQRRPDHTPHIYGRGEGWLYGNGAGAPSLSDGSTESPVDSRPSTGGTYSSQQPLTQRRSTQNNATTSSNATPPSLSAHLRVRTTHLTPQPSSNRYALSSPSAYSDDSSINEIPSASESFHPIPIPSGSRGRRRSKSTDEKQRPRNDQGRFNGNVSVDID